MWDVPVHFAERQKNVLLRPSKLHNRNKINTLML